MARSLFFRSIHFFPLSLPTWLGVCWRCACVLTYFIFYSNAIKSTKFYWETNCFIQITSAKKIIHTASVCIRHTCACMREYSWFEYIQLSRTIDATRIWLIWECNSSHNFKLRLTEHNSHQQQTKSSIVRFRSCARFFYSYSLHSTAWLNRVHRILMNFRIFILQFYKVRMPGKKSTHIYKFWNSVTSPADMKAIANCNCLKCT